MNGHEMFRHVKANRVPTQSFILWNDEDWQRHIALVRNRFFSGGEDTHPVGLEIEKLFVYDLLENTTEQEFGATDFFWEDIQKRREWGYYPHESTQLQVSLSQDDRAVDMVLEGHGDYVGAWDFVDAPTTQGDVYHRIHRYLTSRGER